ncbi:HDOD domain-containing protein [Methylomagnum sp.]
MTNQGAKTGSAKEEDSLSGVMPDWTAIATPPGGGLKNATRQPKRPVTARSLVQEVGTLFSMPGVIFKAGQLLDSPYATNAEIGEVVINDPLLTARVLQLANSRLGSASSRVDMVSESIAIIGLEALRELVAATPVTTHFNGIPPDIIDMERFWLNSVVCGAVARSLAFRCRVFQSEPLFIAGLLHKLGRQVFYTTRPDLYCEVLSICDQSEDSLNRAERAVFGFTHAEVGAELLRSWGLPQRLQDAVAHYLAPSRAPSHPKSAALLHIASALACNIEPSVNLSEVIYEDRASFERGAWNLLGLPLHDVPQIIDEGWAQAFEIFKILQ